MWTSAYSDTVHGHDWAGLEPDCQASIRFDERSQEGVDQNYTYHVDRGRFDLRLLQHANTLGASVYEGIRVNKVDFSGDRPRIQFSMGNRQTALNVRIVVDASGRKTLLGNQLGLKVMDEVFNQYAIHTWFEGFDRAALAESKGDYIFIHFLPISNTWVWQIPITETVTSVGVVTQKKNFAIKKDSREKFFWDSIATRPELYETLKSSHQVRPFTDEGDYSYAMKEICGDGFVIIGDAGRFVDPIFSSGVSIALNSAKLASADIIGALERGDYSKQSFDQYMTTQRQGGNNWYAFISLYYRLNVLFTAFLRDPLYRLDILKLLQGDVYDEKEPPVLQKMRSVVSSVERNPNHVLHKYLGDLTVNSFAPTY